jgi:photosystem II stability/assembly factor-like uncharacterized protein
MKKTLLFGLFVCCLFFKTTLAQENWYANYTMYNNVNPPNLNSVYLYNQITGLSCGSLGYIAFWTVGVEDLWMENITPVTNKNLNSITIVDSSYSLKSFCIGDSGIILKSNNVAPYSFLDFYFQNSPTTRNLNSVVFTNYLTGYVVGDTGTVVKTTDGGNHWYLLTPSTSNSLYSVQFPSENIGYAVGANGTVIKTTNNGDNWILKTSPLNDSLYCVWFTNDNTGYVVSRNGAIYKTTDGGDSWQNKPSTTTENLNAIRFSTSNTGYASGNNNKILKTIDAGETWTSASIAPLYHYGNFKAIGVDNSGSFIATVGTNGTAASTQTDGGSIQEKLDGNNFAISPNPAKDKIKLNGINTNTIDQVVLYNSSGMIVKQYSMPKDQNETSIDVSNLSTGLYFVMLTNENGCVGKGKFVKQ